MAQSLSKLYVYIVFHIKNNNVLIRPEDEEHHKTETFHDEYVKFLREYNVDFDEKYLWT